MRFLLAPVCLIVLAVLAEGKAAAQTFETVEVRSLTLTNEQFLAGDTKGGEPVTLSGNLHLPAGDNWTLAGPCRAYINRLAEAGYDAVMTEYPGVGHAFDGRVGPPWTIKNAPTLRNCHRVDVGGTLINKDTGKRFTWEDACVERGVSGGYDAEATTRAEAAVSELLTKVFSLPQH